MDSKQKHSDYLEVFQEVTRLISSLHDPQQVMDLVVRRLPKLLEVDAATIRLLDVDTDSFILGAAYGLSEKYLSRSTIDSSEVMAALKQGTPIARKNIDVICDHDSCIFVSQEGVKSAMSLPIIFNNEVIGLLRLLTKDSREFAKYEIAFAMSLAEQVGMALTNSRLFQELEVQVKFLSELREISSLVNSTLNLDEILKIIVDKLPPLLQVKGCTVRLLHPATNRLELVAASGVSEAYLNRGSISRENAFFKALSGEPVAIYDAENDLRVDYHDAIRAEGIKSILVIPIKNGTDIIGILRLLTAEPRSFTPSQIDFTVTVAEEGGSAIQKARTYRQITLLFAQIEEHERFLQTILDSLWLQLLVIDPDKRIIMANRFFLETRGLKENQVLGELYHKVVPWHRTESSNCPLNTVFQEKKALAVLDHLQDHNNSAESKWYERHLTPIHGLDGSVDFVIEAVRDITDQQQLAQEKMARMKLEGVVEMAGTAAHELNTPLFAALGTAQLLRDDLPSEEMIQEMDMIIRNMKIMGKLTREMTDVIGFESRDYVGNTKIVSLKSRGSK
ncbi:MAG: PAS sensor protein [Desulfotalea sp.]|nr:MAG: PAS sensor protein [Desulfotalea sp.]